jgi:hypothetical protein
MINPGRFGNFRHVFPLYNKVDVGLNRFLGITLHWDQHPEESRQRACLSQFALQWKYRTSILRIISETHGCEGKLSSTCIETSKTVSGAGLTSVMSCAAADVMSDPADRMAGCIRGASVLGLKIESGDG